MGEFLDAFRKWDPTLLATLASVIVGVLPVIWSLFHRIQRRKIEGELVEVTTAIKQEESARHAALLERVAERVPAGLTASQFQELLDELTRRVTPPAAPIPQPSNAIEHLISSYHEQALHQARAQFWFSVGAASVGFAWILITGVGFNPDVPASALKVLPGAIMDAVAFLFFRQAAETRQRATELYDRLRTDRRADDAATVVANIDDKRLRSAVRAQIALHRSGLEPKPIDLSAFLTSDGRQDDEARALPGDLETLRVPRKSPSA